MKTTLLLSESDTPQTNLAWEERLFLELPEGEAKLLVYRNRPCVVVGLFQNPWRECDVDWLEAEGVPLLRRISGGGAVWHDRGNLNLSWIGPRSGFDRCALLRLVRGALAAVGLDGVEISAMGDLTAGGKKISGNAFCLKADRALHHATLLVDADLDRLRRALRPDRRGWEFARSTGVASRPASVANVAALLGGARPEGVVDALVGALAAASASAAQKIAADGPIGKYGDWEWNFGRTPPFAVTRGGAVVGVEAGRIADGVLAGRPFPGFSRLAQPD